MFEEERQVNGERDLAAWNQEQIAEMLGDDNRYFAGQRFGHSPTKQEAVRHYVECGGPTDFARRNAKNPRFYRS
ncbi:MAG: hypothetical protein WDZ85_03715 [Candidatus Paceibacterota bacterium]